MRLLGLLLLLAGLAFAQEGDDESGITIDEVPSGPEEEPKREEPPKARPARETGKKPSTVVISKKVYSLSVPDDWVMIETEKADTELAWEILLPGSTKRSFLVLARNENLGDVRCAPYYEQKWLKKDNPDAKIEVRTKPYPRVVFQRKRDETEWVDLFFWASVRNNLYMLRLDCAATDFPQAETDMIAVVESFTAKVEVWPPIPKGYETSQQGTWLIAQAPSVKASLSPLLKELRDVEKRFKKDHGSLPKSDAPLVVLVHNSQGDATGVDPGAAEGMQGFWLDARRRRMFAVPIDKDGIEQRGWAAWVAHGLLFYAKYGDTTPWWILSGERTMARAEAITGKSLPNLDSGFVGWISKLRLHTWDEHRALESMKDPDWETLNTEYFFYVGMLHNGKYKKEYRAFLEDFEETGDGEGALQRQFGEIDQGKIREATRDFVSKIREIKREE